MTNEPSALADDIANAADAIARMINAEPWQPLPGMTKLRCTRCFFFWFAAPAATPRCPDCVVALRRHPDPAIAT